MTAALDSRADAPYFLCRQHTKYGEPLFARTVGKVNCIVMLRPDTPLPAAVIARVAQVAYTPALSALSTLEKRGVVRRTQRVGHDAFEPDRKSVYYPMAYATALVDLPLDDAVDHQRVYSVYAYGSLAIPGGGTPSSDLDLLIVGDIRDRAKLVEALDDVGVRLHRRIDPFILTPEAFETARREGDLHVASALAGVRVMGDL